MFCLDAEFVFGVEVCVKISYLVRGGPMFNKNIKTYIQIIGIIIVIICIYKIYYRPIENLFDLEMPSGSNNKGGIILNLISGLGNQIFIYAAALSIRDKLNVPVLLLSEYDNLSPHSKNDYRHLFKGIEIVNKDDKRVKDAEFFHFSSKDPYFFYKEEDIPLKKDKFIYLKDNYYQNYNKIQTAIPEAKKSILSELSVAYPDLNINKSESAFIQVRRGDFLTDAGGARLLPVEYYYRGLEILNSLETITTIYIISDDIPWCKKQTWNTFKNIVYFEEPDEMKTLYLMSQCHGGAVLSNSSFACWGAFLGPYEANGKIVYSSSTAFLQTLPSKWIRIDLTTL